MRRGRKDRDGALPYSETLVRIAGLAAWAMMGITSLAAQLTQNIEPAFSIGMAVDACAYLGFGGAFWYNTRVMAVPASRGIAAILLALQSAIGFVVNTDLIYIVAAEVPLVLPSRLAVSWILAQTVLLTGWISWLDMRGAEGISFLPITQLPHIVVAILTDLLIFALHGFAFCMGYLAATEIRGRRNAERVSAELAATQELLAQTSRVAERGYIAQELHDTLGHHLVALKLNLELAERLAQGQILAPLSDVRVLADSLLNGVREVVGSVRARPIIDLRQAVQTLLSGLTDIDVRLVFPQDLAVDDAVKAHALFRCVQEAVTNAIKHAESRRLWIEFGHDEHKITLNIRDGGKGGGKIVPGYGLTGMRERLEASGGALDIQTAPGRGFAIAAWVPKPMVQR